MGFLASRHIKALGVTQVYFQSQTQLDVSDHMCGAALLEMRAWTKAEVDWGRGCACVSTVLWEAPSYLPCPCGLRKSNHPDSVPSFFCAPWPPGQCPCDLVWGGETGGFKLSTIW